MGHYVDMMSSLGSAYGIACSLICCFVCLAVVSTWVRNRAGAGLSGGSWALAVVFAMYVGAVLQVAGAGALSDIVDMPQGAIDPETGDPLGVVRAAFNFVPFSDMGLTFWLNVLMFVPLGALLPLFGRRSYCMVPVVCFAFFFSLLIEASQMITSRAVDVNDLVANVAGAAFGYLAWRVVAAVRRGRDGSAAAKWSPLGRGEGTWWLPVLLVLAAFVGRFMLYWPFELLSVVS